MMEESDDKSFAWSKAEGFDQSVDTILYPFGPLPQRILF